MEAERLDQLLQSAGLDLPTEASVDITSEDPVFPTRFPIGEVAAAALAACGAQAARLWELRGGKRQTVGVDVRSAAASLLSFAYLRIDGQARERPSERNPCVALYECRDGRWIHLHGAHPHPRDATLDVLGCTFDRDSIAAAVRRWNAQQLEDALAERLTCGAMVRTTSEWLEHEQGAAIAKMPVVELTKVGESEPEPFGAGRAPLSGVRVLDLTRVLAGPTCGRTLAQHGAEVLHISSPNLPTAEVFDIDTGRGKRSAFVDLDESDGAERLRSLLQGTDVFIDGYRSGALERRGFGVRDAIALRPGLMWCRSTATGTGAVGNASGWEQLAQSVAGIATDQGTPERPQLLPAAACDYTTGYLAAFGAMAAIERRAKEGGSWHVRASLSQTALWIQRQGERCDPVSASSVGDANDLLIETQKPFGVVRHLRPAVDLRESPAHWERPTVPHGYHEPSWED